MQQQPEAQLRLSRPPAFRSPTELGVASLAQELEVREGSLGLVVLDTDHSARPLRPEPAETVTVPNPPDSDSEASTGSFSPKLLLVAASMPGAPDYGGNSTSRLRLGGSCL